MVARALCCFAAVVGGAGCAARVQHSLPIAVLIDGDRAAVGALPAAVDGLALHELVLPAAPATPPADSDAGAAVTRARAAYVRGELEACRGELQHVDVAAVLAAGDRAVAARALAFDAACAWAAMAKADAGADAARLASYGLELPEAAVAPDVEALLGDAIAEAGRAPHAPLMVTGATPAQTGARLRVDGRPATCALPCELELAPGEHVLAVEADGFAPAAQLVRLPDVARVAIAQVAATPAQAVAQWRARQGRGLPETDATGAALMARFGGERRIAWLHGGGDARLVGGLVVDGALVARADTRRGDAAGLVRELAYDGKLLARPAVWQRPWFWIAVSAAVVVVTGAAFAATYTPPTKTSVSF